MKILFIFLISFTIFSVSGISSETYLNIFWNQHQPSYKNLVEDNFTAPYVRMHALRDYYSMAALLLNYPKVHVTFNLSSILILQIDEYIEKLNKFADKDSKYFQNPHYFPFGKLDHCLDLTFKEASSFTLKDRQYLTDNFFQANKKSMIDVYPGYKYLYDKAKKSGAENLTIQDIIDLKIWYSLSWAHSYFKEGDYQLIGVDGDNKTIKYTVKSIHRLMKQASDNGYTNSGFTEEDAIELIVDQYYIMKFIIPVHKLLQDRGQIEVVTTPYTHPILPMIYDSDVADDYNSGEVLPKRFNYPEDANRHVRNGALLYKKHFGKMPSGMWPGEGAVSEDVIKVFHQNGIRWISTGNEVGQNSGFFKDTGLIYRIDEDKKFLDGDNSDSMSIVFRSGNDYIGFDYGGHRSARAKDGSEAADDFIGKVSRYKHNSEVPNSYDIIYTNTADGENVWDYYYNDGRDFLEALYRQLNEGKYSNGATHYIKTTTPGLFIKKQPLDIQFELEPLAAGSWVGGNFSTWVGENDELAAWNLLKKVRNDFEASKVPYKEFTSPPAKGTKDFFIYVAWQELFFAEGSDWFWWFGNDQDSGRDADFDYWFRLHLSNIYTFTNAAGYEMTWPVGGLKKINPNSQDIPSMPSFLQ